MRSLTPVYMALTVVSVVVSVIFWRDIRSGRLALEAERQASSAAQQSLLEQRQLAAQLRDELADVRARLASVSQVQVTSQSTPPPAVGIVTPQDIATQLVDAVKQQKALLDNSGYHKARIAEVIATLKRRNPLLAKELGISEQEANAIFEVLAEDQLRKDALTLDLVSANGVQPDAAAIEEVTRAQEAQQQERNSTLLAMLGSARYEQLLDIEHTRVARTRMVNIRTLLEQSGQPLTDDQMLRLTKVVGDQQKREERESQELFNSGQADQASQVDRAVEGDRRILEGAAGILAPRQLEIMRQRFEQRQAMERASGVVQARELRPDQQ
jgi:enamine deaminase RidA (YjgF/YER057c/UK114 family)